MTLDEKYTAELDRYSAVQWQRYQREDDYWCDVVLGGVSSNRPVTVQMVAEAIRLLERKANATNGYERARSSIDQYFWYQEYWEADRKLRDYPDWMLVHVKYELARRVSTELLLWIRQYYGDGNTFSSCHHGTRTT